MNTPLAAGLVGPLLAQESTTTTTDPGALEQARDTGELLSSVVLAWLVLGAIAVAAVVLLWLFVASLLAWLRRRAPIIMSAQDSGEATATSDVERVLRQSTLAEVRSHGSNAKAGHVVNVANRPQEPALDLLPDNAKFVAAALQRIRYRFRLDIALVSDSPRRPVAAAAIVSPRGKTLASESFVLPEPMGDELTDQLPALGSLVGSWLYFTSARLRRGAKVRPLLGTTNWRSFGYFRIGAQVHTPDGPNRYKALRYYGLALDEDASNTGALFNRSALGYVPDMADGAPPQSEAEVNRAIRGLHAAQDRLSSKDKRLPFETDTLWYRAAYLHAVAHLHRKLPAATVADHGEDDQSDITTAHAIALDLAKNALLAAHWLEPSHRPMLEVAERRRLARYDDFLRPYVLAAEPRFIALYASTCVELAAELRTLRSPPLKDDPLSTQPRDAKRKIIDQLKRETNQPQRAETRRRALLNHHGSDRPSQDASALEGFLPIELVQLLTADRELWSTSGDLNLACFYSRLASHLSDESARDCETTALQHLLAAVENEPQLRAWAPEDPALKHLKSARADDFEAVIGTQHNSTPADITRVAIVRIHP